MAYTGPKPLILINHEIRVKAKSLKPTTYGIRLITTEPLPSGGKHITHIAWKEISNLKGLARHLSVLENLQLSKWIKEYEAYMETDADEQ